MGNEDQVDAYEGSVQLLAFQIHLANGGSELDNWLEAEEVLRNS